MLKFLKNSIFLIRFAVYNNRKTLISYFNIVEQLFGILNVRKGKFKREFLYFVFTVFHCQEA